MKGIWRITESNLKAKKCWKCMILKMRWGEGYVAKIDVGVGGQPKKNNKVQIWVGPEPKEPNS